MLEIMFETLTILHAALLDPSRIPVAIAAILLTVIVGMIVGPVRANAAPFYWLIVGRPFGGLGLRLDRRQRSRSDLVFRGFIVAMFVIGFSFAIGRLADVATARYPFYRIADVILLSSLLSSGAVWFAILRLYFALKDKKPARNAYLTIAQSTRIDLSAADDFTVTRNGMALAARSFDKAVVAPIVWYLIAGLPVAFVYAGLAAMVWRFGKEGFSKGFGACAVALEKLMGVVPSVLAGILLGLAGLFTPTGGVVRGLIGLMRSRGVAHYPEGGAPVTAMAYALKVSLNGPAVDLDGSALQREWVGPAGSTAKLGAYHLGRAIYIAMMAHLLFIASLGAMLMFANL